MIAITSKSHRSLVKSGYSVEQYIPNQIRPRNMDINLEDKAYVQVRIVRSEDAFKCTRYFPTNKGVVIYAKYSEEERKARERLVHEILVEMRDRKTNRTAYADLAVLS